MLQGDSLAFSPEKKDIAESLEGMASVGISLHIRSASVDSFANQPEIFSAGNTNVGIMAGLIAERMKGGARVVTMGGMGANAVSSILKATMIAQGYMSDDLGEEHTLALVPRYNEFEENGEKRVRM